MAGGGFEPLRRSSGARAGGNRKRRAAVVRPLALAVVVPEHRSAMTRQDDEARLLQSLETAMQAARALDLRDLEHILKMAALELLHQHVQAGQGLADGERPEHGAGSETPD
jgi:hypothetical protein